MNALCYKVIFSKRLGALVAVGEHATAQGKAASGSADRSTSTSDATGFSSQLRQVFLGISILGLLSAPVLTPFSVAHATPTGIAPTTPTALTLSPTALPTNGVVTTGAASIATSGANMQINQTTDKASINWNTFNVGSAASVNILQNNSSSVLLNRVIGSDPSQIMGKISANGQVMLINPNGVVFGNTGSVTATSFTASTMALSDADFNAGNYNFQRNGSTAGILNQGSIKTNGGYVALLGATVTNDGTIATGGGDVVMAAGNSVGLPEGTSNSINIPVSKGGKVKLVVQAADINTAISNTGSGIIQTEGGQVLMQAASVRDVLAGMNNTATITHSGSIDTTGSQGGAVTLRADNGNIVVDGKITANSTGTNSNPTNTAGGDIIIGRADGDKGELLLADTADVSGATLESKGGFVETSGHRLVTSNADGSKEVKVLAKNWLLDPYDIEITDNATLTSGYTSKVAASTLNTALNAGTAVTIQTTVPGNISNDVASTAGTPGGTGNILVSTAISKSSGANDATLTLIADNGIDVNANITASGAGTGKLNVAMTAKGTAAAASSKGITVASGVTIDANGGRIDLDGTVNSSVNTKSGVEMAGVLKAASVKITGTAKASETGVSLKSGSITTSTGDIEIIGKSVSNIAVYKDGTTFKSDGGGKITVTGTGSTNGAGIAINNGAFDTTGDVSIDGTSASGFGVWVVGSSAIATRGNLTLKATSTSGTALQGNKAITTTGGFVDITATSTSGTPASSLGSVTATGDISIKGTINTTTSTTNRALNLQGNYKSDNGTITLTAVGSGAANGLDILGTFTTTNKDININTDTINVQSNSAFNAGTGAVNIKTVSTGIKINVGSASVGNITPSGRTLGLDATALTSINAGALNIGSSTAGTVTVNTVDLRTKPDTSNYTPATAITITSGSNIAVSGSLTTHASTTALTLNAGAEVAGAGNLAMSNTGGAITVNTATNGTLSGVISGGAALVKQGAGTTTLAGDNNYAGGTTISAGTLEVGGGGTSGTLGSNTGAITNNGTLRFNRSDAVTLANVVTGTGALTQAGAGTLTLTGANDYSGTTTINTGRILQVGASGTGGATGALGSGNITNNGSLIFNRAGTLGVTGVISGTGAVTQSGTGTTTVNGANSYAGGTTISGGTLQVGQGGAGQVGTGAGAVVLSNGANLSYVRSEATTISNAISGTGNVTANITGAGNTLAVTGAIGSTGTPLAGNVTLASAGNLSTSGLISAGNIQLTGAQVAVNGTGASNAIAATGTLDITGTNAATSGSAVSLASGVQLSAAGNLTITGTNTDAITNTSAAVAIAGASLTSSGGKVEVKTGTTSTGGITVTGATAVSAANGTTFEATTSKGQGFSNTTAGAIDATGALTIKGTSTGALNSDFGLRIISSISATGNLELNGKSASSRAMNIGTSNTVAANISSSAGTVTITGEGTGVAPGTTVNTAAPAVLIQNTGIGGALIKAFGDVTITGTNTALTSTGSVLDLQAAITSDNGKVTLNATNAGSGAADINLGNKITVTNNAVNINADTLAFTKNIPTTTRSGAIDAGTGGTVNIKTMSTNGMIDVGGVSVGGAGTASANRKLGLGTTTALNSGSLEGINVLKAINTGTLNIGTNNGNTGAVTVSTADLTGGSAFAKTLNINSGSSIAVNGTLTTHGSTTDLQLTAPQVAFGASGKLVANAGTTNVSITATNTATGATGSAVSMASGSSIQANNNITVTGSNGAGNASAAVALAGSMESANGAISISGTAPTTADAIALNGSTVTTLTGGGITLAATGGGISSTGTNTIENYTGDPSATGKIAISLAGNTSGTSGINLGNASIKQSGNGGISVTSTYGNVTVKDITNSGTGNVVLAAGTAAAAGDKTGGNVAVASGATLSNAGGLYIYTGDYAAFGSITSKWNDLTANQSGLSNLYYTGSSTSANKRNVGFNKAYSADNTALTNGATSQVVFRENKTPTAFNITLADTSATYGDVAMPTSQASEVARLKATFNTTTTPTLTQTDGDNDFKVSSAEVLATLSTNRTFGGASSSGYENANTAGTLYNATITDSALNTTITNASTVKHVINKANLTQVAASKTYDGLSTVKAAEVTAIQGVNGETFTASAGTAAISDKNVATANKTITDLSGLTLASSNGGDTGNYNLSSGLPAAGASTNSVSIAKANLTQVAASKTYDGLSTVKAAEVTAIQGVNGETFTASAGTAAISDKNVATANKTITDLSGLTLASSNGGDTGNYNLSSGLPAAGASTNSVSIAKANLTQVAASKTYDGLSTVKAAEVSTIQGVNGETFTASAGTAAISDKNVATANKTITDLSGLTLASSNGGDTGNYNLSSGLPAAGASTNSVSIAKANLTQVAASKTYDGLSTVKAAEVTAIQGVNGETFTASAGTAAISDKNVATANKTITDLSGLTLASSNGGDTGNYNLSSGLPAAGASTNSVSIAKANLTQVAASKTYDGLSTVKAAEVTAIQGVNGETFTASAGTAAISDKNVATANKTITDLSGLTLASSNGGDTGNYNLSSGLPAAGASTNSVSIAKANLTQVAASKTYDGLSTVKAAEVTAIQGVNGETFTASAGTAAISDKNVATANKTITDLSGLTLASSNGGDTGNYNLSSGLPAAGASTNSVSIAKANLTQVAASKTYDGLSTVKAAEVSTIQGVNGETFTASAGTAAISDKNVATANKTITDLSGLTLASSNGGDTGNYNLSSGLPAAGASTNSVSIAKANLTQVAASKTYDGLSTVKAAEVSTIQGVNGETFTASGGTAAISDKNVATANKTITDLSGLTLASSNGGDTGNYNLSSGLPAAGASTNSVTVSAKALTIAATAANKTYDGGTSATATLASADIISGDTVTLGQTSASFSDKNAGTGKTVTVAGLSLSGTDAGNYSLANAGASTTTTADISAKALTVAATAANKTYDGGTSATATLASADIISGDTVTLGQTGASFSDKNAGTGKTVTVAGLSLSGTDAGNYSLANAGASTTTTADISAKALTVAATAANKTYDGGTSATATLASADIISGDTVTLGQTSASFSDKNAGTGKTVTVAGLSLSGTDAGNYSLANAGASTTTTADITPKALTVSAAASTKVSDGNTSSPVTPSVSGLVGTDTVSTRQTYDTAEVGTGKTLTVDRASTINDGNGGANYVVSFVDRTDGVITADAASSQVIRPVVPTTEPAARVNVATSGGAAAAGSATGFQLAGAEATEPGNTVDLNKYNCTKLMDATLCTLSAGALLQPQLGQ